MSCWNFSRHRNTGNMALFANTPTQAKFLLHSLEQAERCIGFHVNANKAEYTCFKREGSIFTLSGSSLKLKGEFTYFGSIVSSNERDVYIRLPKAWTAVVRLSIIWKSGPFNEIKREFLSWGSVNTTVWMHPMDANKMRKEKALGDLYKDATSYFEQILEVTPHDSIGVWPLTSHL